MTVYSADTSFGSRETVCFFFAFLDGTAGGRKAGGDGNGRGGIRQFRVLRERRRGAHVVDRNGPRDRGQGQMLRRRSAGPGPPAAAAVVGPPEFRGRGLGQRVRGQMPGGPVVALGPDQDLVRGRPVRRHRRMGTVGRLRRQISARLAGNGSAAPNDRRKPRMNGFFARKFSKFFSPVQVLPWGQTILTYFILFFLHN